MIVHIARREWLETRRHPAMLGICALLLVLLAGLCILALGLLQVVVSDPESATTLVDLLGSDAAVFIDGSVRATLTAFDFLVFSQYLGFLGVIAGHSLLHDRQVGTLPFLWLAPVSRSTLLMGKVLGAWVPMTVLYLGVTVSAGLVLTAFSVAAEHPGLTARSASWWVAVLLAGPAWGLFVATGCTLISSLARDVRLAQQAVWFGLFFVQLLVAFLITGALGSLAAELVAAGLGLTATLVTGALASQLLLADLER